MRLPPISLLAALLLALFVLPSIAGAAPARWPSANDVQKVEPDIATNDAVCMARFYHARLSRADWLVPYYSLTPAEKRVSTAGFTRCMTRPERVAMRVGDFTRALGKHIELRCVANQLESRSWAVRLAVTSRLLELRMYDRVFRACGMTGVVYATFAHQGKLDLTPAERRCSNQVGSVIPLYQHYGVSIDRPAVAKVFDRCVERPSRAAMWRRLARHLVPPKAIACAADRLSRSVTFKMLYTDERGTARITSAAVQACKAK